jgi:hypothetical protein
MIKSRRMRWRGHVVYMGEMTNAHKIFGGNPEGKRPHGRPKHRWEDNIKDIKEVAWEGVDWLHLAQDKDWWQALVNSVMKLWVSYKAGNFLTSRAHY